MPAAYRLAPVGVIRTSDGKHITRDMLEWAEYRAWVKAGNVPDPEPPPPPPPPPTVQEVIASLTLAVQGHLDATAKARGYDGILSACTYATDTHPPFANEGRAAVDWRGAVWRRCYEVMGEVQTGQRPVPTDEELIALLPAMVWPA